MPNLELRLEDERLALCHLPPTDAPPWWAFDAAGFCSVTRTADEWSVVCAEEAVPAGIQCERDWRMFQVAGPLEFSLIGILSSIAEPLADAGVSIFALSAYETDYVLVKASNVDAAIRALGLAGHLVRR
ncbi:MAG TPA: ACT domain-containing protein [Bryobacteraceae bacterium]|nr:ACT domain-containing protein [Bryobacteraceae bacterium]